MTKKKIEVECKDCGATGLYIGFCEKDGCAVVCARCGGTGKVELEYVEFIERKPSEDIKRVFKSSCGYVHGPNDVTTKDGRHIKYSEAGCTYEEWLRGVEPKPVKELFCPYMWTNQSLQNKGEDKNDLYKTRCDEALRGESYIPRCKYNVSKDICWKIFEGNMLAQALSDKPLPADTSEDKR